MAPSQPLKGNTEVPGTLIRDPGPKTWYIQLWNVLGPLALYRPCVISALSRQCESRKTVSGTPWPTGKRVPPAAGLCSAPRDYACYLGACCLVQKQVLCFFSLIEL